jgi:hypothetical protein
VLYLLFFLSQFLGNSLHAINCITYADGCDLTLSQQDSTESRKQPRLQTKRIDCQSGQQALTAVNLAASFDMSSSSGENQPSDVKLSVS